MKKAPKGYRRSGTMDLTTGDVPLVPTPPELSAEDLRERNADIVARRRAGQTYEAIGVVHALTRERCRQIVRLHGAGLR